MLVGPKPESRQACGTVRVNGEISCILTSLALKKTAHTKAMQHDEERK
jgi:hypothetical protein